MNSIFVIGQSGLTSTLVVALITGEILDAQMNVPFVYLSGRVIDEHFGAKLALFVFDRFGILMESATVYPHGS